MVPDRPEHIKYVLLQGVSIGRVSGKSREIVDTDSSVRKEEDRERT